MILRNKNIYFLYKYNCEFVFFLSNKYSLPRAYYIHEIEGKIQNSIEAEYETQFP